jgi:hypothetical protein
MWMSRFINGLCADIDTIMGRAGFVLFIEDDISRLEYSTHQVV